jgi:arylsulfatase A-like enzyme
MPYLLGNESGVPHSSLYWRQVDATGHIVGYAVRSRDLKLVIQPGNGEEPESVALYDLAADPGETRNLAPLLKRETAKLRQAIHDWDRKVGAPRTWRMGASAAGP